MADTEDPRAVYDRALNAHRARYRELRQIAATLVYLRIKLENEHPDRTDELSSIADEAERAKEALIAAGNEVRALERERLRAIAALSAARVIAPAADVHGLEEARERVERIAGENEIEYELRR
jgi:hypothetical protein